MCGLRAEPGEHLLTPGEVVVLLFANLPHGAADDLLKVSLFDLFHQRTQQLPIPMVLGLGKYKVLKVVDVFHVIGNLGRQQTLSLVLRGLSGTAHFVFVAAGRNQHLLAKLHVPLGLLMELFQFGAKVVMRQLFECAVIHLNSAAFYLQHL